MPAHLCDVCHVKRHLVTQAQAGETAFVLGECDDCGTQTNVHPCNCGKAKELVSI